MSDPVRLGQVAPWAKGLSVEQLARLQAEHDQRMKEDLEREARREAKRKEREAQERTPGDPTAQLWFERGLPHTYLGAWEHIAARVRGKFDGRAIAKESWVVFTGPAGAGKTTLAVALAWQVACQAEVPMYLDAYRLGGERAKHKLGEGEPALIERAFAAKKLVLDDVGAERHTALNAVPDVIYERHAEGRPTWITTGLTFEQMRERYGDGIARRVFERALIVELGK